MKTLIAVLALMAPVAVIHAQSAPASSRSSQTPTRVERQTVDSHPQHVIDTPQSDADKANSRMTDGLNTKRGARDPRERDSFGTPKSSPPPGQGTNNRGSIPPESDINHHGK